MGIVEFMIGLAVVAGVVGVAAVVAVAFVIGYGVRRASYTLRGQEYVPLLTSSTRREYEHQDVAAGSTADSIRRVLKRYARADVVGKYAQSAVTTLDSAERETAAFHAVLDSKFQPQSLSWEKFSFADDAVNEAILQNCAELSNRVQTFNHAEYRQLERAFKSASKGRGTPLDSTQAERRQMLLASLADMDALVASNDKLLLELNKLSVELGKLEGLESTVDSDRIVEEIRTLAEETRYYSRKATD